MRKKKISAKDARRLEYKKDRMAMAKALSDPRRISMEDVKREFDF